MAGRPVEFDEDDVRVLQDIIDREKAQKQIRQREPERDHFPPDVYILCLEVTEPAESSDTFVSDASTGTGLGGGGGADPGDPESSSSSSSSSSSGEEILKVPGMDPGTMRPGSALAAVWRIGFDPDESSEAEGSIDSDPFDLDKYKLLPVLNPDGSSYTVRVFNYGRDDFIPGDSGHDFFEASRDKFGQWLVPSSGAGARVRGILATALAAPACATGPPTTAEFWRLKYNKDTGRLSRTTCDTETVYNFDPSLTGEKFWFLKAEELDGIIDLYWLGCATALDCGDDMCCGEDESCSNDSSSTGTSSSTGSSDTTGDTSSGSGTGTDSDSGTGTDSDSGTGTDIGSGTGTDSDSGTGTSGSGTGTGNETSADTSGGGTGGTSSDGGTGGTGEEDPVTDDIDGCCPGTSPGANVTVSADVDFSNCGGVPMDWSCPDCIGELASSVLSFTRDTLCGGEVVPVGRGYWRGPVPDDPCLAFFGLGDKDLVYFCIDQTPASVIGMTLMLVDRATGCFVDGLTGEDRVCPDTGTFVGTTIATDGCGGGGCAMVRFILS